VLIMHEEVVTEKVMCAVDDSTSGLPVVMTARRLAEALGAEMIVVHAVPPPVEDVQPVPTAIRAWLHDADPTICLLEGSAGAAILEAAEEQGATLLVIGARGRGPVRSALLGSVSQEVVAGAGCPVVVVPAGAGDRVSAPASGHEGLVVCGVDNSDLSMAAASVAGRLARRLGYGVVVVHARQNLRAMLAYRQPSSATPPMTGQEDSVTRQAEQAVQRGTELAGGEAIEIVEPGPPVSVLKDVADRYDAELILIGSSGRTGAGAALLGSVATELPVAAARPVVVIPRRFAERGVTNLTHS
jgi:nucleotide-binding universal stress UspA family protein